MPELVVIAPIEMAPGLRLAGIPMRGVRNAAEAADVVHELRQSGDVRVAIVPEHFVAQFAGRTRRDVTESDKPHFIPLPMDWQGTRDAREDFEACLRHLLGFRITLSGRVLQGEQEQGEDAP